MLMLQLHCLTDTAELPALRWPGAAVFSPASSQRNGEKPNASRAMHRMRPPGMSCLAELLAAAQHMTPAIMASPVYEGTDTPHALEFWEGYCGPPQHVVIAPKDKRRRVDIKWLASKEGLETPSAKFSGCTAEHNLGTVLPKTQRRSLLHPLSRNGQFWIGEL